VSEALAPPESLDALEDDERIYSHAAQRGAWNDVFFESGWVDAFPYVYFKNGLDANLNLIFSRGNVRFNSAFPTIRHALQRRLIPRLIDTTSAKYIISPESLEKGDVLELIYTVEPPVQNLPKYFIYLNKGSLGRFRLVSDYVLIKSVDGLSNVLEKEDFQFKDTAILEVDPGEVFEKLTREEISPVKDEDQALEVRTNTDKKAILIVADSFYPGWRARVNGVEAEILAANINQRAVIIPAGESTVKMDYYPERFYKGVIVSLGSLAIFVVIVIAKPQRLISQLRKFSKRS
jgi:hypothetical protein